VSRGSRVRALASLWFPLDAVDVRAGRGMDDNVRLSVAQFASSSFTFCQIDRNINTGTRPGTERNDRRPRSLHGGDEQAAKLTCRSGDDHPLVG